MKLALIGSGVRAPLFVASALRRAERVDLDEICLTDIDAERLRVVAALCRAVADRAGSSVRITATPSAHAALEGARHVVTTIRVGQERGRALDERIALKHGVLGQETTGPGGFAMALRSIPAVLGYAELAERVSPGAWIFNFTNPAGLVTQALRNAGFERTIGICDGANSGQQAVADWLKVERRRLQAEVFGLNHLSWTRRVMIDGRDCLPSLLGDEGFRQATTLRLFDPELIQRIGMWLSEYLFYYYYAERAVELISADAQTRGEEIVELNRDLFARFRAIDVERHPQAALQALLAYEQRRGATYMHYAQSSQSGITRADEHGDVVHDPIAGEETGEGYAGVALGVIEALETGVPYHTGLNVPNHGAIDGMRDDDVVEVSCIADRSGVRPLPIGAIPEHQLLLMLAVKRYERLTVEAVAMRARATAVEALMAHPLVLSYSRAGTLVAEYLAAHAADVGDWNAA